MLYVDVIKTIKGDVNTKMKLSVFEYQNDYEYSYMVYVKGVIMFDSLNSMVGEKQLISFARAIVSNPAILVLDEATSSIDTENEKMIIAAMSKVMKNRTSLLVAHRLSTVVDADKIIVLKNGKILESGNHLELLRKKGYYFNLYKNQFLQ